MSADNLIPFRSEKEAREKGKRGGVASGKARRKKRLLRECLEILMEKKIGDMTTADAISVALVDKALSGDTKAYEIIRDTLGQKPTDKVAQDMTLEISWQK